MKTVLVVEDPGISQSGIGAHSGSVACTVGSTKDTAGASLASEHPANVPAITGHGSSQ
jgi:hypothetical protein